MYRSYFFIDLSIIFSDANINNGRQLKCEQFENEISMPYYLRITVLLCLVFHVKGILLGVNRWRAVKHFKETFCNNPVKDVMLLKLVLLLSLCTVNDIGLFSSQRSTDVYTQCSFWGIKSTNIQILWEAKTFFKRNISTLKVGISKWITEHFVDDKICVFLYWIFSRVFQYNLSPIVQDTLPETFSIRKVHWI